jgi:hypothetical protein
MGTRSASSIRIIRRSSGVSSSIVNPENISRRKAKDFGFLTSLRDLTPKHFLDNSIETVTLPPLLYLDLLSATDRVLENFSYEDGTPLGTLSLDMDQRLADHEYGMMLDWDASMEQYKNLIFINNGDTETSLVLSIDRRVPNRIELYSTIEAGHNPTQDDVDEFAEYLRTLLGEVSAIWAIDKYPA